MAQRYDFEIEQGASVAKTVTVTLDSAVYDLTGYNARLEAREKQYDTTELITLTSSPAAGLTVQAANGIILIEMTPTQTAALDFIQVGYNLEIYTASDATVVRLLEGFITLNKEFVR